MVFHYDDLTLDLEEEDRATTTVVGVRYAGSRSSISPDDLRRQGGWPGTSPFQAGDRDPETGRREPGPVQIGIVPDTIDSETVSGGTLSGLEAFGEFDVLHDPADIAQALLERNYLPPSAFGAEGGTTYDPRVRRRLFDKLDLDDVGILPAARENYRQQLADIAGLAEDEVETETVDKSRAQEYQDDYTRAELKEAAAKLREDSDDITLSAPKTEYAEWLAERPPAEVREALRDDGETDDGE